MTPQPQAPVTLWDDRQQKLLLVRDRFGIKPLYYSFYGGVLRFSSEIKALLQDRTLLRRLHYPALAEHFTFQNTFGDKTFFEDIHLLPPATWLTVDAHGTLTQGRYWQMAYRGDDQRDEETLEAELGHLLAQAVQRQLMSEVPVGGAFERWNGFWFDCGLGLAPYPTFTNLQLRF